MTNMFVSLSVCLSPPGVKSAVYNCLVVVFSRPGLCKDMSMLGLQKNLIN